VYAPQVIKATILLIAHVVSWAQPAAANEPKPYPLAICIVSDEKLNPVGAPIALVYEGQEFKFCCRECRRDFKDEPEKFLQKLNAAE